MYKIFISYAHAEKDRADRVYRTLLSLGQTVWMDEATADRTDLAAPGSDFLGVPAGQRHAEVIADAIGESATFLICDSLAWRDSEYCHEELRAAQVQGTRIVVLDAPALDPLSVEALHGDDDRLDDVVATLEQRAELALAHLRLDQARRATTKHPGWWGRLFGNSGRLADANLVLTEPPGVDAPRTRPELTAFATQVVRAAAAGRRSRLRVSLTLLVVLALLASVAGWLGLRASRDAAAAVASEHRAESLYLASQSLAAGLPESLPLAERAWAADHNPDSRSALAVARSARRLTEVTKVSDTYAPRQLLQLDDGRFAITDRSRLIVVDPAGGQRTIALSRNLGAAAIAEVDGWIYAVPVNNVGVGQLVRTSIADGSQVISKIVGVTAMAAADGVVWIATKDGRIGRYDADADALSTAATLGAQVTALEVTGTLVRALTIDRDLVVLSRTGDLLSKLSTVKLDSVKAAVPRSDIGPDQLPGSDQTAVFRVPDHSSLAVASDRIMTCGSTTHVLLGLRILSFTSILHIGFDQAGTPVTPFARVGAATSLACQPDGDLLGAGLLQGRPVVFAGGQTAPADFITVADRFGATAVAPLREGGVAVIDSNGLLKQVRTDRPTTRALGTVSFVASVGNSFIAQDLNGDLVRIDGNRPAIRVGHLSDALRWTISRAGTTIAGSDRVVYRLAEGGITGQWALPGPVSSFSLDSEGKQALLLIDDRILVQPLDATPHRYVPEPSLRTDERLIDLAMDSGALFAKTSKGRILRLDPATGKVIASWEVNGSVRLLIDVRPGPAVGVVVHTSDGIVRLLDANLHELAARPLGVPGGVLQSSVATGLVMTTIQPGRVIVLDGESLELRQEIEPNASLLPNSQILLTADGDAVGIINNYTRGTSDSLVDMVQLRDTVTQSGVLPPLGRGEEQRSAQLDRYPICLDCAP